MNEKINFAWPVTSENADVYNFFTSKLNAIRTMLEQKKIIITGAGIRGCLLLKLLEDMGFKDIIFCDNNPQKQGQLINQYDIISIELALELNQLKVFLISPENSETICNQLSCAGLIEGLDWFSFDICVYNNYIAEYSRNISDHLLILGDCGFSHIALTDSDKTSLGDMIKAQCGEQSCKVLAMHGLGQQAQFHILNSLIEKGEKPKAVVMLVLEALTPKAHLMPRTQHPALMNALIPLAGENQQLEAYAKLAQERFNKFQIESFANSPNSQQSEKLFMQMNYLFKIKESTEGVLYLKKTIQLLNSLDIPFVLYIPPVNYMQGEVFFKNEFKAQYTDNFKKLFQFLNNENLKYSVADASFILTQAEFAAVNTIDETTNYLGRTKTVDFLTQHPQLKNFFTKE